MTDAPNTLPPGQIPETGGVAGVADFNAPGNFYNALDMMVRQILANQGQTMVVLVKAVHGGGLSAPCTVDVQPMVNQVDGLGKQTPHGVINGLPAFRYQAGGSAVILDPVAGDIGLAVVCGRDISNVKETKAVSGPGSFRQSSWADGCYLGGFLNGATTQYVWLKDGGIDIVTPGTISMTAGGDINITAGGQTIIDTVPFIPHVHKDVTTGGDLSGPVSV